MSKRNLVLFIIVLVIIIIIAFAFFYFYQPKSETGVVSETINFLADFLPFGKSKTDNTDTSTPTDISGYVPTEEVVDNTGLKKISSFPIAGYGVFSKERYKEDGGTEFAPALRYVDRATGNIYQTFADQIDERKFSSTIIPKVYEAFFGNETESVVMRYLKSNNKIIETYLGTLPKEYLGADLAGTNQLTGSFLPENISDMSISSDGSSIFYLFDVGENSIGITLNLTTNEKSQVFDSPFTEWLSFYLSSEMITLTTKPSATVPGYMYSINPNKKDLTKILGGINGLTTLTSPNGELVLYADNNLSLNIFNIGTGETDSVSINTLPEKCVWNTTSDAVYCAVPKFINQVQYPDSWYQGEISFSDEIWKININSGNSIKITDPTAVANGEEVDAIKLNLDKEQNYLFFVNKKDSYLWELKLN